MQIDVIKLMIVCTVTNSIVVQSNPDETSDKQAITLHFTGRSGSVNDDQSTITL